MLRLSLVEYRPRYAAILDRLDPREQWELLHAKAGGAEPVLLCWERPPLDDRNFCHRRLVAAWFEQHLGVEVPELYETGDIFAEGVAP